MREQRFRLTDAEVCETDWRVEDHFLSPFLAGGPGGGHAAARGQGGKWLGGLGLVREEILGSEVKGKVGSIAR
jgi:hypothetical protein